MKNKGFGGPSARLAFNGPLQVRHIENLANMARQCIGTVSYALHRLGLPWNSVLYSTHAMALIMMAAVWKQLSYNLLFFLAGLASIPKSLFEAAAIGGALQWS